MRAVDGGPRETEEDLGLLASWRPQWYSDLKTPLKYNQVRVQGM